MTEKNWCVVCGGDLNAQGICTRLPHREEKMTPRGTDARAEKVTAWKQEWKKKGLEWVRNLEQLNFPRRLGGRSSPRVEEIWSEDTSCTFQSGNSKFIIPWEYYEEDIAEVAEYVRSELQKKGIPVDVSGY
jgi:hypothetical protein